MSKRCREDDCEAQFSEKDSTIELLKYNGNKWKPYSCDICSFSCKQLVELIKHKKGHIGKKTHECKSCTFKCLLSSQMKRHVMIHLDEKPLSCDQCNFKCCRNDTLVRHQKTHSSETPFSCDQCEYRCNRSESLVYHKLIHSNIKSYSCNICNFKCAQSSTLHAHRKIHFGEKPHQCSQCNYRSIRLSSMKLHIMTHTGEKPYLCEHCGYRCITSSYIQKHRKMHELQLSYKFECIMQDGGTQEYNAGDVKCSIRCKSALHLDYHIQRNHTKDGIAAKFHSENKLADFFKSKGVDFDRDWKNFIQFRNCNNIDGNRNFARPDFYLFQRSFELGVLFFVCNDEFQHRQTKCEFQRMLNISTALQQTPEFKNISIVFTRLNPHFFRIDGKYFDPHLKESHELLWKTIQDVKKEDLIPGVNLIYVNYDRSNGNLSIFDDDDTSNDDFVHIFKERIIKIV